MEEEEWYWLSSTRMTVAVMVRDGIVRISPPITGKFIGQPLSNLVYWMSKQPGFQKEKLHA